MPYLLIYYRFFYSFDKQALQKWSQVYTSLIYWYIFFIEVEFVNHSDIVQNLYISCVIHISATDNHFITFSWMKSARNGYNISQWYNSSQNKIRLYVFNEIDITEMWQNRLTWRSMIHLRSRRRGRCKSSSKYRLHHSQSRVCSIYHPHRIRSKFHRQSVLCAYFHSQCKYGKL